MTTFSDFPDRRRAVLRGIGLMVLAVALFSVMDTLVKWLTVRYGVFQIMFFRSAFALVPVLAIVARLGGRRALVSRRPGGQMVRSLVGAAAIVCFFYSFKHMPLADVYAIYFASPLVVSTLSVPLLGERVGGRRWSVILIGFGGVLWMVAAGGGLGAGGVSPAALVCVMATVLYALALLLAGRLARTEGSAATVFYFTLTCTGVGAVLMGPDWVTPTAGDFLLLAITGLVGGTAQFLMTESVRVAPPSVVAPFDYTAMIWAVALGYAVFGDVPTGGVLLGGAVVAASGIMLLRLETRRSPMVAEAS